MARWRFIYADQNHLPVGELLNLYDREVNIPVSKLDTFTARARLDNPLADALMTSEGYIKGYRDNQLLYHGILVTAEESADKEKASVVINSASTGWNLQKRLANKYTGDRSFALLQPPVATDRSLRALDLIQDANAEAPTGVSNSGDLVEPTGSQIDYPAPPYKPVLDCVRELSSGIDGFDWRFMPVEPDASGDSVAFAASAALGVFREEAIFEYGFGRNNLQSYRRVLARDGQATRIHNYGPNGPTDPQHLPIVRTDPAALARWGLLEDVALADITEDSLRAQLVSAHLTLRNSPREVVTFEPHIDPAGTGRMPQYGEEYEVGDFVLARAVVDRSIRFNGWFRVWAANFKIDSNEVERVALTMEPSNE
jgi:hypothetical protein